MDVDKDWKSKMGFPINYDSDQSSGDDLDSKDVVMRRPHSSAYLLVDRGDGSEADLLGTTPPRERRRDKQKWKTQLDSVYIRDGNGKRDAAAPPPPPPGSDRLNLKKHFNRKLQRSKDRDMKVDLSSQSKADSLPSPSPEPAVPTLVESCNRFMSLTSRLKCRGAGAALDEDEPVETRRPTEEDTSRANFHKTFSMLINMGNMDKGCRRTDEPAGAEGRARFHAAVAKLIGMHACSMEEGCRCTISREEQVWQNELKDLIWLELQARIAGRTPAQQDAYLCAQRDIVPTVVQNIRNYRFVNPSPCVDRVDSLGTIEGSTEDLTGDDAAQTPSAADDVNIDDEDVQTVLGCMSFGCQRCAEAVGKAMREVGTLLDSFYNAAALYPSVQAMQADHPLLATQLFHNRLKAMCLWYNTALHMRLKVLAVRRMLRTMRRKGRRRSPLPDADSDLSRQSSDNRPCQVRFNVSTTPTDSNNSDSSALSEGHKDSASDEAEPEPEGQADTDEVDSAPEKALDQSGQATPEILISDNRYGTTDTVTSTESGYHTEGSRDGDSGFSSGHGCDVYDVGSLEEMTRLKLLDKCAVSPFRSYHHEMLKTQGVRRCMMFVSKLRHHVLHKVYETLERQEPAETPEAERADEPVEVFDDTKEDDKEDKEEKGDADSRYERRRFGCWSAESLSMRLPSYRNHFLLLSSVCMEAVHDYLSLRLEDRPANPSCLTVKQLIHELKEGLDIATDMRAAYARNIEVALAGHRAGRRARADLLLIVRTYDSTVEAVLKQYLSYVRTMSAVERLPRWALQAEWAFTARLAKRLRTAALLAPAAFSEIACNQLNRILHQFGTKFTQLEELKKNEADPTKDTVYALCREAQSIYACEREPALHAAQWARALAARLARAPPPAYGPQRQAIFESLMRLRDRIGSQTQYILEASRGPPGALADEPREFEGVVARVRELLLQVFKLGFELHKELYKFAQAPFQLLEERGQRRARPASLQPPRAASAARLRRRPETLIVHESFNPMVHKELHRFANDSAQRGAQQGAQQGAAPRRGALHSPPKCRARYLRSESIGEDVESAGFDDKLFEDINSADQPTQSSIELLLSGEKPPERIELRSTSGAGETRVSAEERLWARVVARAVVQYARCWMRFVVQRCDTGRGLRPRWASQGLEFLMLACDPCNTKHLLDEEFEELKKEMDGCISHVIGSRPPAPRLEPAAPPPGSPDPARRPRPRHSPLPSHCSAGRDVPPPPTPPSEPDPLLSFHGAEPEAHNRRVLEAVQQLDLGRDRQLRTAKSVGRVLESAAVASYEPKLRQLKFKWQRGLKIGAGTFGKVYTVVNTESGQLLAMKELSVGAGDRRALQRAANELRVLEGVLHPHLVRYYGAELHREELLLFMELCVEGSLEALVGGAGALPEHTVRRYAQQLLSAVHALHARAIAHRDVKSGNIFLTNEGHCLKLGDFGCAVKIRANSTAAGELQGCVGTQAYMAPEVFMKSSGHGRAADVWSLGCVVAEMASGKRPWSDYDSNYQIMFVVGMGGRPAVPDTLSDEGQQFCLSCLTHEPDARPRAEELMRHHFLMVKSDDDCNCEPAFLLT